MSFSLAGEFPRNFSGHGVKLEKEPTFQTPALVSPAKETHNNNNNNNNNNNSNNNGLLTVHLPSGSSPVKNYNIKK